MKHTIKKILSMISGLFIVLSYAFKKPVTISYPEERRPIAKRFRGLHRLKRWEDGCERCVGCELCAVVCPAKAIYVLPAENTPGNIHSHGERYAEEFRIDMIRCIYCGLCEEACPTGAIVLGNEYELSTETREQMIFDKKILMRD